ncbi:hypothetical protein VL10_09215 [Leclercia adecarboxylata]|nr:hypothetical protein VL10_09215 [Leclercia adecarboxylata]KMN61727.1 hypothetical protein VK95_22885 [Leclercia sp. LK8]
MNDLKPVLEKILHSMIELDALLKEEIAQLSRARINPVALQTLSDEKSKILATIGFYDDQRKEKEGHGKLTAPYSSHALLYPLWEKIVYQVRRSNKLNQNVFNLLDIHMKNTNGLKELVKNVGTNVSLYDASGHSSSVLSGKVYDINI